MNKLSASLEDYIEAIYIVLEKNPVCRVTDIMKLLNVSKPSIVNAMSILKGKNLINQEKYGFVELTDEGKKMARRVYSKHSSIRQFLISLFDIEYSDANALACKIEHVVPENVIKSMENISKNMNPALKKSLLKEKK
ncbi:TPA: metal-dependent transcriptional regulator [candidate division WOR-3 bacterium]|jgi:DtxR family Mn-dependent transcriptional regulator|uniref:Metal-dependent transcriptional regulator n=1 Tax=candidate division WOR-3 bacterium TaxID=2052148 RepID=A0A350HAC0_UNCW3|nr:metal-dependent transcriptional regulator [candidate division WOR-3 bacterium]